MSARQTIIDTLTANGHTVVPWGGMQRGQYLIVRPGGISDERTIVEVWVVNPPEHGMADPDHALSEYVDTIYDLLRKHLLGVNASPGPPYNPTGKTDHSAMILTGADPNRRGLGQ